MKDPRINRLICHIILFTGFGFLITGALIGGDGAGLLYVLSAICIVAASVWNMMKVRCPRCGAYIRTRVYSRSRCPYCGKKFGSDDED